MRIWKNCDSGGNPAASKSDRRWEWKGRKFGKRVVERRIVVENGMAKVAMLVKEI